MIITRNCRSSRGEALSIVEAELLLITGPDQAAELSGAFTTFLDNRELVGGIGFGVLIFFSSLAFRMLEDAFAVIFAAVCPISSPT